MGSPTKSAKLPFVRGDGGRAAAGFRGTTGDCVCRAVAIASGRSYAEVYADIQAAAKGERRSKRGRTSNARNGVFVRRKWFKEWMTSMGFQWVPCMGIGTGCTVHLAAGEVPSTGRHVVSLSRHYTALIDGVVIDMYDPQRESIWIENGRATGYTDKVTISHRCVYGYWRFDA